MTPVATLLIISLGVCFAAAVDLSQHPHWNLFDHKQCGESASDRIIGGVTAELGQYPWMARLGYLKPWHKNNLYFRAFKCGGALINQMYVLTAAHCVVIPGPNADILVLVRLGEHDVRTDMDCQKDECAPPVQDIRPSKVIAHKEFDTAAMKNDIALIRLEIPAHLNPYVTPICLPYDSLLWANHVGSIAEVAGWGVIRSNTMITSNVLQTVNIPMLDTSVCRRFLGTSYHLGKNQLCGGGVVGHDSCLGDSGGPLMKPAAVGNSPPQYFAIGLVSYGSSDCGTDNPAVYTDVARYMVWILNNVFP